MFPQGGVVAERCRAVVAHIRFFSCVLAAYVGLQHASLGKGRRAKRAAVGFLTGVLQQVTGQVAGRSKGHGAVWAGEWPLSCVLTHVDLKHSHTHMHA